MLPPWFAWVMSALSQDLAVLKQSMACVDQVKLGLLEIAVLVSMMPTLGVWECPVLLVAIASVKRYSWLMGPTVW